MQPIQLKTDEACRGSQQVQNESGSWSYWCRSSFVCTNECAFAFGKHHVHACYSMLSLSNTPALKIVLLPSIKLDTGHNYSHCVRTGSLVLGQDQNCYGGCFNPQFSLNGDLADVRIWNKALTQVSMADICTKACAATADTPHAACRGCSGRA